MKKHLGLGVLLLALVVIPSVKLYAADAELRALQSKVKDLVSLQIPVLDYLFDSVGWGISPRNPDLGVTILNETLNDRVVLSKTLGTEVYNYLLSRNPGTAAGLQGGRQKNGTYILQKDFSLDLLSYLWPRDPGTANNVYRELAVNPTYPSVVTPDPAVTSYKVTTTATVGGTITKSSRQSTFKAGESLKLTAEAKTGHSFKEWQITTGQSTVKRTANPLTLTISADVSVKGVFVVSSPAVSELDALTNEYLTVSGCGNDELVSSFTLSNGETLAHCLRSGEVKVGDLVVAKSALSTSGCSQYGTDYRSTSVAWNEGRLYLCRQMKAAASGLTVINRSTIRVGACPSGYQSSSSAVQKNTTYHHCVKTGTLSFETSAGGKESWLAGVWAGMRGLFDR